MKQYYILLSSLRFTSIAATSPAVRWYSVLPKELNVQQFLQTSDYLPFIGYTELVGALFLILPGFHSLGTFILLGISTSAALTHIALKESPLPPAILGVG